MSCAAMHKREPVLVPARPEFFLGTHRPHWLGLLRVPIFVSRRPLARYRKLPRATADWALDSGGFTELSMHGRWLTSPEMYAAEARRYRDEVGSLRWAAPQDWMCEPTVLQRTGLSVREHQRRTIDNYLELRRIAPDVPWIPVVQGWAEADYLRHVDAYERAGVDLRLLDTVGVGTVCRRQATAAAVAMVGKLAALGLRLHGFGIKMQGLRQMSGDLVSADSMAWSYSARRNPRIPGHAHKNCANCVTYALAWRRRLLATMSGGQR
jgi:hypothetical protein